MWAHGRSRGSISAVRLPYCSRILSANKIFAGKSFICWTSEEFSLEEIGVKFFNKNGFCNVMTKWRLVKLLNLLHIMLSLSPSTTRCVVSLPNRQNGWHSECNHTNCRYETRTRNWCAVCYKWRMVYVCVCSSICNCIWFYHFNVTFHYTCNYIMLWYPHYMDQFCTCMFCALYDSYSVNDFICILYYACWM